MLSTITFNRPARVIAAADLTGDGWDDLVVAEWPPHSDNEADRTELAPMHLMVSQGDGRFVRSPAFSAEARDPHAVAGDFNGDGALDLAIFDAGVYATARSRGYGNPPQLFLSQPDGSMAASSALADAVAAVHSPESSGPGDLHVKNAIAGDIDGDGDLDMWVESAGGANVENHFMVNDGAGGFVLDEHRIDNLVLTRRDRGEFWRYDGADLVDLDRDGDLDLVLGQLRDTDPTHINQGSVVLENDGRGRFGNLRVLPAPKWFGGFTAVPSITHYDLNSDGLNDLILVHVRNDGTNLPGEPFTGRYVQLLINAGGGLFEDETQAWMGSQATAASEGNNSGDALMRSVDGDSCLDLVISGAFDADAAFYRRVEDRFALELGFEAPELAVAADVNGDGSVDFVAATGAGVEVLLNLQ